MHSQSFRSILAALPIAVLVGACASSGGAPGASASPAGSPPPAASSSPSSPSPSELVLKVVREGGFVAPSSRLAQPPIVTVYADGRVISGAPVTMEYPGRLVAPLQVRSLGPDGARAILAAAADAGLTRADATYPAVGIADAPDTVFVIVENGTRITTRFGALAEAAGMPGGQGASDAARAAATGLLARLTDPADSFGAPAAPTTLYSPTAYKVWATPGAPAGSDPALTQQPLEWPLATPLARFGRPATDSGIPDTRVGTVGGADTATLRPVLDRANALTPFVSGGVIYTLLVRPMLPDESPAP